MRFSLALFAAGAVANEVVDYDGTDYKYTIKYWSDETNFYFDGTLENKTGQFTNSANDYTIAMLFMITEPGLDIDYESEEPPADLTWYEMGMMMWMPAYDMVIPMSICGMGEEEPMMEGCPIDEGANSEMGDTKVVASAKRPLKHDWRTLSGKNTLHTGFGVTNNAIEDNGNDEDVVAESEGAGYDFTVADGALALAATGAALVAALSF
jgi:hypothetical protein